MKNLLTENIDIWTSVQIQKNGNGRGNGSANQSHYGIKKLRELILELAVRGKLVPQDPSDEPASVLLEKIAKEKARLIKEGKIKKQAPLPEIVEDEEPYKLPNGWEWARIGDVCHDWGQKTPVSDFTYIEVSGIDNIAGKIKTAPTLTANEAPSRARKIVKVGTVIYSTVRPYLQNICVIDQEYIPEPIASTAFAILHPFQNMPGKYFTSYLRSPIFVRYVEAIQTGIAYPAINDKQFFGGIIPIPPLAEQHRIVTKVAELMAICDQLEQKQTGSNAAHQTLVETLLATLTSAANRDEFIETWQRLASNFDILFTTEQSIDQLKRTILQLAVMGKLVSQDPNDEPASVLLKKIADEKARLVKEGIIKKEKLLPDINEDENPFELPNGWEWVRLGSISEIKGGKRLPAGHSFSLVKTPYIYIQVTNMKNGTIIRDNLKYISKETQNEISQYTISKDDLYITIAGTIGDVGTVPEYFDGMNLTENAAKIIAPLVNKVWLQKALSSNTSQEQFTEKTNQLAQPKLALHRIASSCIAVPPLSEQHRIVAKVDELMTICDNLKARLQEAQTTQIQLADAIVEQAVG